ncbi:protein LLP homolog [Amphibalanus amphitrite]|uniref:protein LLP homolog n=1 Tax=Amphibalanus amphitrite TaxID=1232801 RepID=UPI001C928865|nr:protein LLP homolog [Amphibalanus amphitrite]XP_043234640.1 protein LLP homolog [Amphibalanus amphitrite]XP_043234641.1 protein LLP homolog [Amphibalanus amphitrite]XP_043234642.1 protein LLP homolog [Amphibalanus amphitrite]XP_043234644.1 protein LLP homolog [Amphibalanus amphitrite]XP_043234645.1 protein LLP homolog [Amphibalanus amphitrite]XP_043234646.1 protein LLP homolog [Amphibalanus amphitrite]XP_043234647.1 protein LLP homolog [Amphibalanus amphitrite]
MGKSMRSKRKQKLKRERREKFKVKELKKLKDMLRAAGENVDGASEAVMVDAEEMKSKRTKKKPEELAEGEEAMEVTKEKTSSFHPVTLKNEHGNYPVWMNRRQIKRHKKLTSKTADEGYKKGRKRRKL